MFGTGMLSQFDFNSFSWHILFLIGGGNVLGDVRVLCFAFCVCLALYMSQSV